ncbi:MAG: heavy-metal-associated domain-containing protein [Candidatus Brocadiae bacterium]|nr:heavy-metal-associated domain-containing protein [Candidatus Brocadiia bacterium]
MTCSHCAASIKRALEEVPGVATATVDLATGLATVTGEAYGTDALCEAVRSLGYQAEMRPS